MRPRRIQWRVTVLLAALYAGGCAPRPDRWPGVYVGGTGAVQFASFLAAHPLTADQAIRADVVTRSEHASQHLVQIAGREQPHRHVHHDLTVVVVRGGGTLHVESDAVALATGDVATVPRAMAHWFERTSDDVAVAFVTFSPPLEGPDNVPVIIDSPSTHQ